MPRAQEAGLPHPARPPMTQETQPLASWTRSHTAAGVGVKQERMPLEFLTSCWNVCHISTKLPIPRDGSQPEKSHHLFLCSPPFRGKAAHCAGQGGTGNAASLLPDPACLRSGRLTRPQWLLSLPQRMAQDCVSLTLLMLNTVPTPHEPRPGSLINYANVWWRVG